MTRLFFLLPLTLVGCAEGPFELSDAEGKGPEGPPPPPGCGQSTQFSGTDSAGHQFFGTASGLCDRAGNPMATVLDTEFIDALYDGVVTSKIKLANCGGEDDGPYDIGGDQAALCEAINSSTTRPDFDSRYPDHVYNAHNITWVSFTANADGVHSLDSAVQNQTRTLCAQDPVTGLADPTGGMQGTTTLVAFGEDLWQETYFYTTLPDITLGNYADLWENQKQTKYRMNVWDIANNVADNYKHWVRGAAGQWATGYDISEMDIIYGMGMDPVNDIGQPVTVCIATMINTDDLGNAVYPMVGDFANTTHPNGWERAWEVATVKERTRSHDTQEVSYVFQSDEVKYNVCTGTNCWNDPNLNPTP